MARACTAQPADGYEAHQADPRARYSEVARERSASKLSAFGTEMGLRNFSPSVEAIARKWRAAAIIERAWKCVGDAPTGESNPFYVRSGNLGGVAKPREESPPPELWPRAAIEKICSDLAYDLGLPVPPVALWSAPKRAALPVQQLCVSLVPFSGALVTWADVEEDATLVARLLPSFRAAASAMVAFDSWVANRDRRNPGNILLRQDPRSAEVQIAYIDFANSLLVGWRENAPHEIDCVEAFPDAGLLDVVALSATVRAIERLPKSSITDVVQRIPPEFLSDLQKTKIINALTARQSILKGALTKFFAELEWEPSETSGRA